MERRGDGQATQTGRPVVVRSCRLDQNATTAAFRTLDRPRIHWTDSNGTVIAGGVAERIQAAGRDRFTKVRKRAEELFNKTSGKTQPEARPRLYGGFAFTETPTSNGIWDGYPAARFVLPAIQLSVTPDGSWLTAVGTGSAAEQEADQRLEHWHQEFEQSEEAMVSEEQPAVLDRSYTPPRAEWQEEIEEATARIAQGELRKVVLAQALSMTLSEPVRADALLGRLSKAYPDCFQFLFDPADGGAFFGATPERLVSVDGYDLRTEALAGSIGRGETTAEDEWLATQLRESEKNNHEHDIVVETIREQLEDMTRDVRTGSRTIRKLANVQHLQTPISAELDERRHVLELVEALHPTPAVGGLPPEAALATIRETEAFDRGWYAAPVGWIDAAGNGTFAVAIRSALARDSEVTLFAGAGIVDDSEPNEEWDELQLKYRPILDALE